MDDINIIVKAPSNTKTEEKERIMMESMQCKVNSVNQSIKIAIDYPTMV